MRPLVRTAMSTASAHTRRVAKEGTTSTDKKPSAKPTPKSNGKRPAEDSDESEEEDPPQKAQATEFQIVHSSAPRRLNDIAQAPPTFAKLPKERGTAAALARLRGDKKEHSKADNVVSMTQRARMEEERELAVQRYRDMKAAKSRSRDDTEG
jgi:hypothetical protein